MQFFTTLFLAFLLSACTFAGDQTLGDQTLSHSQPAATQALSDSPPAAASSTPASSQTLTAVAPAHPDLYSNWVDDEHDPIEQDLRDKGFTDADFAQWAPFVMAHNKASSDFCDNCYVPSVDELIGWKKSGLSPALASQLVAAGFQDPAEARQVAPYFVKQCKGRLYDLNNVSPYSVTRKCFYLDGYAVVQLLDEHQALASNDNQSPAALGMSGGLAELAQMAFREHIVLLQYRSDAPNEGTPVHVLVVGAGAYKYTATSGALMTAAKMRVLLDLDADSGS